MPAQTWISWRENRAEANNCRGEEKLISTPDSRVQVWVVPTDEEIVIARDTMELVK